MKRYIDPSELDNILFEREMAGVARYADIIIAPKKEPIRNMPSEKSITGKVISKILLHKGEILSYEIANEFEKTQQTASAYVASARKLLKKMGYKVETFKGQGKDYRMIYFTVRE